MKSYSGISGSKPTCGSPEHTIACHTLLQLIEPSHPPNSVRSYTQSMYGIINMKWEISHLTLHSKLLHFELHVLLVCLDFVKWTRREIHKRIRERLVSLCGFMPHFACQPSVTSCFEPEAPALLWNEINSFLQGRCSTRLSYEPKYHF